MPENKKDSGEEKNRPCPGCNGTGQTSFFGGESRFMFTWEDCPDCCGTGVDLADDFGERAPDPPPSVEK
jgi:DnaJ-class molecular chaperone